jgi:hypothetical protein
MCRLAYIPFKAKAEDADLISTLFEFLELSFGGSGNGVGFFQDGKPIIKKGINIPTAELANYLIEIKQPSIYHTRLASMGSVSTENCHPFSYNGVLTAHNGHWIDAREMAKMLVHAGKFQQSHLKDMTDSEVIACLVGNYGFGATDIINAGVILSLYGNHAKVSVKGEFEVARLPDGRFLYASEFPKKIIDDYKIGYYMKFERGSIAKLTADGPILASGRLVATVASVWPTYKRGGQYGYHGYSRYEDYWRDYTDEPLRNPTPPVQKQKQKTSMQTTKNYFPKRKGKKAKKRPYTAHEILVAVEEEIDFDVSPEIVSFQDEAEYIEMEQALSDLYPEIERLLASREDRRWVKDEVNHAIDSWIFINQDVINNYQDAKQQLENSFGYDDYTGDLFTDIYGNEWVNVDNEWVLLSTLSEVSKEYLKGGMLPQCNPKD